MLYYARFRQAPERVRTASVSESGGSYVSDQDFFFDEDEKPAAKAPAKKASGSTSPAKPAGKASASAAPASTAATVTMTIAVLIGVIGILIGAIGGIFIGRSLASTTVATPPAATAPAATGTGTGDAPQLSPEQLQGDLPSGHPAIGSDTATPAP